MVDGKGKAIINAASSGVSDPRWIIIFTFPLFALPWRLPGISLYLLFKMAACCHWVPGPYRKSTLEVFWDALCLIFSCSSRKPFGIIRDKNHFINVAVLQNKIVYRGLEENYINLCLVFMECHCSDCFISIKRAHCGFIRVEWSPISFSLWPAFPLQCVRITL